MTSATPTRTIRYVVPTRDLLVEHRHRCLVSHRYRIIESPTVVPIRYPANIPFSLITVYMSERDIIRYVDANGWMFDEHIITKFLTDGTIRNATE